MKISNSLEVEIEKIVGVQSIFAYKYSFGYSYFVKLESNPISRSANCGSRPGITLQVLTIRVIVYILICTINCYTIIFQLFKFRSKHLKINFLCLPKITIKTSRLTEQRQQQIDPSIIREWDLQMVNPFKLCAPTSRKMFGSPCQR